MYANYDGTRAPQHNKDGDSVVTKFHNGRICGPCRYSRYSNSI